MNAIVKRRATYEDVLAAPPNRVAELIDGVLSTQPRPAPRHASAAIGLGYELTGPYQRKRGGPGGWIFMAEPELHFGADVVVPDIAGWRVERMSAIPEKAYITLAPDWVCEIVSPSTERLDRGPKRRVYAEAGVAHLWLLDPIERFLEAFALAGGQWLPLGTIASGEDVRIAPFDAVGFPLDDLFPFPPSTP
jgi:Uma2 family endonuclease